MGTQTAIAEAIIGKQADYVLALKGNQPTLHEAVVGKFDEYLEGPHASQEERVTTETSHGRRETRTDLPIAVPPGLAQRDEWAGLKSIGMVTGHRRVKGKESTAVRYHVSSLAMDVKRFERAVRGHWSMENACHWCLDVTIGENANRTRVGSGPQVMAAMRNAAISHLRVLVSTNIAASLRRNSARVVDPLKALRRCVELINPARSPSILKLRKSWVRFAREVQRSCRIDLIAAIRIGFVS